MMNNKYKLCVFYIHKECDYCGYCEENKYSDISTDEPYEDEIIEELYYKLEREADSI